MSRKTLSALGVSVLLSGIMAFVLLGGLASAGLSADSAPSVERGDPYAFLSQFKGRQFPNEMPPEDDWVVMKSLGIPLDASPEEIDALIREWYQDFNKKNEKGGPNPIAYAERMDALAKAEAQGLSPMAANLALTGTAEMLMIPIEFAGTDVISACNPDTGVFSYTQTITGPLNGTIPAPGPGNNRDIWTDTFSVDWYQDLMFGDGVGVVRTDLYDGAGVDLTGVSAANWYEEQSEGDFTLAGDVYTAWIQLDHSVAWYGWDGDEVDPYGTGVPCDGTSSGYGFEFVIDAANKLNEMDPDFDWAKYDVDGDGIVDHLMIIHAGTDNSAGGGTYGDYQLWAHSWDVYCDKGDGLTIGCVVDDNDTVTTTDDIMIANYTHIPEDAAIGVVVHELGHDFGEPDYYDTGGGPTNSTAHWDGMSSGSWSGQLGGTHPTGFNPKSRYFFGWSDPLHVPYTTTLQTVTIGQSEPTPGGTFDAVQIDLPDQEVTEENRAGDGKGLHAMLNNMSTYTLTRMFDLSSVATATFTFDTYFNIETDWDYVYVRASTNGITWTILFNEEGEYATLDPNSSWAWWGPGGLTGQYQGSLTYDLSAYAGESQVWLQFAAVTDQGTLNPGIWVDNFALAEIGYSNDLEDSSDWANVGWEEVPYVTTYPHYYMLEWRNNAGSIASEGLNYNYQYVDDEYADIFPANVPGLLVWYRNAMYPNNRTQNYYTDVPASGPKGMMLVVDSHFEAIPWSGGWWDAGQMNNRRSAMDAAFTLDDTPAWMIHDEANILSDTLDFGSRPAVSSFHDSMGWVPGWAFPGDGYIYRIDRSASVVIPAADEYSTRVRGLDTNGNPGDDVEWLWGYTVGGRLLGTGNPGAVQYGVNIEVVNQATDGSWGEINIYQQSVEFDTTYTPAAVTGLDVGDVYTVTYQTVIENDSDVIANNVYVTYTLDAALTAVSLTMNDEIGTVEFPPTTVWWTDELPAGATITLTLTATGLAETGEVTTRLDVFDGIAVYDPWYFTTDVTATYYVYMPLVVKDFTGSAILP